MAISSPITVGKTEVGKWMYDCATGKGVILPDPQIQGTLSLAEVSVDISSAFAVSSWIVDWLKSDAGEGVRASADTALKVWKRQHGTLRVKTELDGKVSSAACLVGTGASLMWYEFWLVLQLQVTTDDGKTYSNKADFELKLTLARGTVTCECAGEKQFVLQWN